MIDVTTLSQRPTLVIGGTVHDRIPYGTEGWDVPSHDCHDCGVAAGALHWFACDMEQCPGCGRQLISCDCLAEDPGARVDRGQEIEANLRARRESLS
jgi:hypothetical protein